MADRAKLIVGTAGVPDSSPSSDTLSGLETLARLGIKAMEVEFVHGVNIQQEKAELVGRRAAELGISLTCHGPYYINLNAKEKEKRQASEKRILDTARAGHWLGARSVTFHAAFFLDDPPDKVHQTVRDSLSRIMEKLASLGVRTRLSPETTGKPTQYGSLEELLKLCQELPGLGLCIDFAHLHARSGGRCNTAAEFSEVLKQVETALGRLALENLHLHLSGIDYSPKGEKKHLQLEESDLKWKELLKVLKTSGTGGILIAESPDTEQDALLLQKTLASIK